MARAERCVRLSAMVAVVVFTLHFIADWRTRAVPSAGGLSADQRMSPLPPPAKGAVSTVPPYQSTPKVSSQPRLGLLMRDEVLIEAVRERFVPASDPNTPYNLSKPDQTFFAQHGQDKMVANIFKNKSGGFFLEAGALDGEYLSNSLYLERHLGWSGVLVEPNPNTFKSLRHKKRRALLLNAGLSVHDRATRLKLDLGGKYPELSKFGGKVKSSAPSNVARVDCFPLFTVLAAAGNPVLDLLLLDVEGVEFKVLQSVPWDEVRVRLLVVETNKVKEGVQEIKKFLTSQGFKFYRVIGADSVYYHPDHLSEDMVLL